MSDREIYKSYTEAKNQSAQLKILRELNACSVEDILEVVQRYQEMEDKRNAEYQAIKKAEEERRSQERKLTIQRETSWLKTTKVVLDTESDNESKAAIKVKPMTDSSSTRNPEPIPGVQPRKRGRPKGSKNKPKLSIISDPGIKQIERPVKPKIDPVVDEVPTKSGRGKDTKLRWRKRTTIKEDYEIDWNNWIDSMREHLEMAKECEKQLMRLEKIYGSHRRKERKK